MVVNRPIVLHVDDTRFAASWVFLVDGGRPTGAERPPGFDSTERRTQTGRPARLPPRSAARRVVVHVAGDTDRFITQALAGRYPEDRSLTGSVRATNR